MQWDAIAVFIFFFLLVTVLGFIAARWRRGDLDLLHEWGLAGRRFGTVITWFLLGGDLYTAYTFIAVPAAMYGFGALNGFFAVPYTFLVYPLVYLLMPRFWAVCKQHGYVTAADFVRDRFGSGTLALVVAITGIIATMPYLALQMFGIEVSLAALGIPLNVYVLGIPIDIPLLIAFIILAAYTYTSGLRAPAMIALVKDIMIFIVLFVAIIYIPIKLGGFGPIFTAAHQKALISQQTAASTHQAQTFFDILNPKQYTAYVTLALGSALALFLYPHSITGVLSSNSPKVVKRNTALLPIYSLMLGFLALLGYMAIAAKVTPLAGFGNNGSVPALILASFPHWFAGFAFAAIAIGALVPAAVMSIAAANLFTRNIYKEYFNKNATERQESQVAKLTSLIVKFGALLFILYIPTTYVLNLQLLGGVWILQTLPSVFLGLYTRWFNRWALVVSWAVAMIAGTGMFIATGLKSSVFPITIGPISIPMYEAVAALIINLVLAVVLTPIFEAIGAKRGQDLTSPSDYNEEQAPSEPLETGREALG
ncbi:sodium:solute symporter [Ktedonosporobacter rubrisoli]|uniref:Sodium:solute symporter n=1 Tax=Ktedonosporobacter rubrisoli TaxID=2509675 RepID=A0A4P6K157_KTERU|nr:sodium:solute symporter [Ktedonosporobacter rubrisoli]QBD81887.1 sodium:solute symporter [Ktedonosporobacter rubrisoli]